MTTLAAGDSAGDGAGVSAKLHPCRNQDGTVTTYLFYCPGCKAPHPIDVTRWVWNGSIECPTIEPSLLCNRSDPGSICHSFIRDGKIEFLCDCFHTLAGQTVDIPDWAGWGDETPGGPEEAQ